MFRSIFVSGVTLLALLGVSVSEAHASSARYRPYVKGDLSGPARVFTGARPSPSTLEKERVAREIREDRARRAFQASQGVHDREQNRPGT